MRPPTAHMFNGPSIWDVGEEVPRRERESALVHSWWLGMVLAQSRYSKLTPTDVMAIKVTQTCLTEFRYPWERTEDLKPE